jgi:hypothetical protein
MAEDDNVHDATQDILRKIQADISAFRAETNERFDRLEGESKTQSELLGKVMDATMKIADTQDVHGSRLNTIDARLANIEKRTGLVKA